ncbi:hypothetical protein [Caloranaerobacter azorensis]|uniref:Uncharacterized protein n=1 Tax=Caloranaerobacter azorensis TaxID=116090 RepID=A0A6P1YB39_9FIRM|nr:hypothetical protein [Caloranaerobacter azorensis]QIB26078.1 hypothetical protein G3A45_01385 [Caloranaerobacter azorensis]
MKKAVRERRMVVELIPFKTFQEKIKIVSEELNKDRHVEVWDNYIYSVTKSKNDQENKMQ